MEAEEPGFTPVPKTPWLKPPQPEPQALLAVEKLRSQLWLEKSWWQRGHSMTGSRSHAVTPFLKQGRGKGAAHPRGNSDPPTPRGEAADPGDGVSYGIPHPSGHTSLIPLGMPCETFPTQELLK